jgi:uncharacterized protein
MGGLAVGGGALSIVAVIFALLTGIDPSALVEEDPGTGGSADPAQEELKDFSSVVLADTEDTWPALLRDKGVSYRAPKLVLFSGAVRSACGAASSAMGPFYCPSDERVYLDLGFFNALDRRFEAPGDFARAYVIAHEIGHHVQNQMGLTERVHAQRERLSPERANALSVRLELQADCFAGIWAHHAQRQRAILERGDVEEGLGAAAAVGDDRLQHASGMEVQPESFTHGSSEQRAQWFRRGLESGRLESCDTFGR